MVDCVLLFKGTQRYCLHMDKQEKDARPQNWTSLEVQKRTCGRLGGSWWRW